MINLTKFGVLLLAVLVASMGTSSAQTVSGTISGTVVDPSDAIVVGASVTLREPATSFTRTVRSNEAGVFVFPVLSPGTYSVNVTMQGFQAYDRADIVLTANSRVSLGTIRLGLAGASEAVTVTATSATVETENADATALLSSAQLNEMMIAGRDVINLLKILPGASQLPRRGDSDALGGSFGSYIPNISGARDHWVTASLDGQVGNDADVVQAFASSTAVDAIAEVKVVMNSYLAENGRNLGPSVNLVSKSGTREFHGSLYWYKRHEEFNATNFFNNSSGVVKPMYRYTDLGGTLGGPVYVPNRFNSGRNKLFFFYSQEQWLIKTPSALRQVTVPSVLERGGDFSQTLDQNGALVVAKDPLTPVSGVKSVTRQLGEGAYFPEVLEYVIGEALDLRSCSEPKHGAVMGSGQFTGQQEQFVPQRLKRERLPLVWQTEPLESGDEVVGESDDFQEESVGGEDAGGDVGDGKVVQQFADAYFNGRAAVIEPPNAKRGETAVGDPDTIHVTAHREQSAVPVLLLDQPTRHNETTGVRPIMKAVFKFGHFPTIVDAMVRQARNRTLERRINPGYHGILSTKVLQGLKNGLVAEARVGARSQFSNADQHSGKARAQHFDAAGPSGGVTGTQLSVAQV